MVRGHDRIRVTARLLDPAGGRTMWSERYNRALADVPAIEGDIASAIGGAIRSNVTPEERRRLSSAPPTDSQAYDLYLRGRFHAGRESPEEIAQAIDFSSAPSPPIPRSPRPMPSSRARTASACSMSLQATALCRSGHSSRSNARSPPWIPSSTRPTWRGDCCCGSRGTISPMIARSSYTRAIALNPNSDEAHHQLGLVYSTSACSMRRSGKSARPIRLNPANTLAHFREGVIALYGGNYRRPPRSSRGRRPTSSRRCLLFSWRIPSSISAAKTRRGRRSRVTWRRTRRTSAA